MKSLEQQLRNSLIVVMLLILFGLVVVTNLSTRNILQDFVTSRLDQDAQRLFDSLTISPDNLTQGKKEVAIHWRRMNPIYMTPNSGYYYVVNIANKTYKSPSLQGGTLPIQHSKTPITLHDIPGPQEQRLIVWIRTFNKNGQDVIISIAENMGLLIKKRKHFTALFIGMGLLGFVLLLALQRFVIYRSFKGLDHTRKEIKQIESGELQQLSEDVPSEIYPLVKEFNHSLSIMQQRMERSRNSLGNLAHALKTPLSLLMQQLDREEPQQAKMQAERIRQLTERELKRARMAGLGNTTQRFDPNEELPTLIEVIKQAHQKTKLTVSLHIAPNIKQFGDREDMLELLGNLLDNACKWASSKVSISIGQVDNHLSITIEDDGQGRNKDELKLLTQRGIRLDESREGHGLGLSICKDIVKLYGGNITFGKSTKLGGFRVEVTLPNISFQYT